MKIKTQYKNKVYEYDYSDKEYGYRSIKFMKKNIYPEFSLICRSHGSNAQKEINAAVEFAVKNNILLSEVIHG